MTLTRRGVLGAAGAIGLVTGARAAASTQAMTLTLRHPDGRPTRYRLKAPAAAGRWPVVLFSHGANSSSLSYDRLWDVWVARGYAVIGPDHIDTGPPATQAKPPPEGLWRSRLADISLPLGRRGDFDAAARALGGALEWRSVAAAGHSFGAVVAQALAGARLADPVDHTPVDAGNPAVGACLAFSPPGPLPGFIPSDAWSTVRTPSFLQTGDADVLPGFVDDWRSRLTGFSGGRDRWTVVGHGVNHYFGGLICRLDPKAGAQGPALDEVAALSGVFLDAYLRHDPAALGALSARAKLGDDGVAVFATARAYGHHSGRRLLA